MASVFGTIKNRSCFLAIGFIGFCMLTFMVFHQPVTTNQFGTSTVLEERSSFRDYDIINQISERVIEGLKKEKILCSHTENEVIKSEEIHLNRLSTIYIITPTYKRPEQIPDLTRLANTLMNVPSIMWLLVEDAQKLSDHVADIAKRSGIPFVHLIAPMPLEEKKKKVKARGVSNRNRAIDWIRSNNPDPNGIIYFADDDNTYDLRLFDEIRTIKNFGMFPVGLITSTGVSTPIVKNGTIIGFYDGWIGNRKFPVDMAGFAFSVDLLLKKSKAKMPYLPGYEEDRFIQSLEMKMESIEPKASNCTKIYVWHTQTKKNKDPVRARGNFSNTNIDALYNFLQN